jgi:ClpP class serine protease
MWEIEGKRFDPITNAEGDLKSAMHGPSLTPDQRASLEQYVQDAFEMFKGNVLRNRAVSVEAMRGQSFFAPRALQNYIIDAIVQTEEEAYEMLLGKL